MGEKKRVLQIRPLGVAHTPDAYLQNSTHCSYLQPAGVHNLAEELREIRRASGQRGACNGDEHGALDDHIVVLRDFHRDVSLSN